jgi:hypothetical protein
MGSFEGVVVFGRVNLGKRSVVAFPVERFCREIFDFDCLRAPVHAALRVLMHADFRHERKFFIFKI